jgi:hypothetical protein
MSRSYKKHPAARIAGKSDKKDKRLANRLFRRLSKILLKIGKEPLHLLKECSNTWSFSSDGLARWNNNLNKKFLRK